MKISQRIHFSFTFLSLLALPLMGPLGCSVFDDDSNGGDIVEPIGAFYTVTFDLEYGLKVSYSTQKFVQGETTEITLSAIPKFNGKGLLVLEGLARSRAPVGTLDGPGSLEVGHQIFPVEFFEGEVMEETYRLHISGPAGQARMHYLCVYDSVAVGGEMFHVESEEGRNVFCLPPTIVGGYYYETVK